MTIGELIQEIDLLMLEEGYIEISEKNDMLENIINEKEASPKLYKKGILHLYEGYSYFEDGDDTYFYNSYDEYESFEEFKKEFGI